MPAATLPPSSLEAGPAGVPVPICLRRRCPMSGASRTWPQRTSPLGLSTSLSRLVMRRLGGERDVGVGLQRPLQLMQTIHQDAGLYVVMTSGVCVWYVANCVLRTDPYMPHPAVAHRPYTAALSTQYERYYYCNSNTGENTWFMPPPVRRQMNRTVTLGCMVRTCLGPCVRLALRSGCMFPSVRDGGTLPSGREGHCHV